MTNPGPAQLWESPGSGSGQDVVSHRNEGLRMVLGSFYPPLHRVRGGTAGTGPGNPRWVKIQQKAWVWVRSGERNLAVPRCLRVLVAPSRSWSESGFPVPHQSPGANEGPVCAIPAPEGKREGRLWEAKCCRS